MSLGSDWPSGHRAPNSPPCRLLFVMFSLVEECVCGVAASDITSKPQNTPRLTAALMSERQNMQLLSTALHMKTSQTTLYIRWVGMFQSVRKTNSGLSSNIPPVSLPLFTPLISQFRHSTISQQPWRPALCMSCVQLLIPSIPIGTKTRSKYDVWHKTTGKAG